MRISSNIYLVRNKQWLMLLRDKKENDINHGKWIGVGGKLEQGETIEECAIRETKEETGYCIDTLVLKGIINFYYDSSDERIYVYTSSDFHGSEIECREGTLSWIDEKDVLSLNLWDGDRIFLDKMINHPQDTFHYEFYYDRNDVLTQVIERGQL